MVRRNLVDVIEEIDFGSMRLKHLFEFTVEDAVRFLVNAKALKNEMECNKCSGEMNVQKRSKQPEDIWWVCRANNKQCSTKSIRSGSFFENAKLSLPISIQFLYMWANDFDNKHIAHELEISEQSVVDWLNMCREVCQHYCDHQQQLGGRNKYIEIDETCIAKQKHHRGKPKRGASQWVFGGVERGEGGLMFAFRVSNRTKKVLYSLIRKHIKPGTTIISDDWPAYRNLGKQLGKPIGYKHYIMCYKKQFARTVQENDQALRIHTNKSEGSWAHLKHKIKRLYGTRNELLASYIAETVFRQNCRAKKWNYLEKFMEQLSVIYA